jgi:formamidopyrimidine-DNA glycosylase
MPELPEVEVVKESLKNNIINLIFKKVIINSNNLRYKINKRDLNKIINKKVLSITRRSKYLLINLSNKMTIVIHLGMTGKFFLVNKTNQIKKTSFYYQITKKDEKHNHVIFLLSNNVKLIYNDVRKFGFIKIILSGNIKQNAHFKILGPEPFSKNFNIKYFKNYLINKNRTIKDILMDQRFVSGLGNIYVNEVLFLSNIKPSTNSKKIDDKKIKNIIKNTKQILKKSIKQGGSSIKNFNDSNGKQGHFQQNFRVYGKEGVKCHKGKCKGVIKRSFISNRSTFFCSRCQK